MYPRSILRLRQPNGGLDSRNQGLRGDWQTKETMSFTDRDRTQRLSAGKIISAGVVPSLSRTI